MIAPAVDAMPVWPVVGHRRNQPAEGLPARTHPASQLRSEAPFRGAPTPFQQNRPHSEENSMVDTNRSTENEGPVRYAVVGLGHIAQAAVLPAFKHAKQNCRLTALVSDDSTKLRELGKKYKLKKNLFSY